MAVDPILYTACEHFVGWLLGRIVADARGDDLNQLSVEPDGRFWLGRLAPEASVRNSRLGARAERLDPCEIGVRLRPRSLNALDVTCSVRACAWTRVATTRGAQGQPSWAKTRPIDVACPIRVPEHPGPIARGGATQIAQALAQVGADGLTAEIHAEVVVGRDGPELVITLVNTSPERVNDGAIDSNLYETVLTCTVPNTQPFTLDALPDSFRYDRRVAAYGVNCGVDHDTPGTFRTADTSVADRPRPTYWDSDTCGAPPDLRFESLADNPLPQLDHVTRAALQWGDRWWSDGALRARSEAEGWTASMLAQAQREGGKFRAEIERLESGIRLLRVDANLLRSFQLMNASFANASRGKYDSWRPFQLGFILGALGSLHTPTARQESEVVDTLWFATGGGKTETYLGVLVTAAFYDRLTGKREGITGWARFPLRMLSLQQTQRFADAFAAAELIRIREGIDGDGFSVGFLVGPGTPNDIPVEPKAGQPDPDDPEMPARYQVLLYCPFCRGETIRMAFDRGRWMLDHLCSNPQCAWRGPLPFRIVDREIYRVLPTVVVGTIDKVANIAMQAAMRGFYAAPYGKCPDAGHGFTYAPRSTTPAGCLFPGCRAQPQGLRQDPTRYAPTLRIQDELHLLRDSLGAIDSHYEALLDHLQTAAGSSAKVAASSATLEGYEGQVECLYRREGRLFPMPGPSEGRSFWSVNTQQLARRFVGLAPRGVTLEFATDRTNETLQRAIREAIATPDAVAGAAGVPPPLIPVLASIYGVHVAYGSTLRDVEAVARSFETELRIEPLNAVTLTGRTPLEDVRNALERLNKPEVQFGERVHLVAASSMLSHGVDVDRLNVMVMLGLPLSTAEFIQTTSRVGRTYPGLVLVMHKIGRERDAGVYRSFVPFVRHADRFVDPVPVTRRSRRVLELTFPGLFMGRLYGLHEPASIARGLGQLTTVAKLRRAYQQLPVPEANELRSLVEALDAVGPLDEGIRSDLERWVRETYRALNDPATSAKWPQDLLPTGGPMRSLRDVEQQIPVFSRGGHP